MQEVWKFLGGFAIGTLGLAWLTRTIISHFLARNLEAHRIDRTAESTAFIEAFKIQRGAETTAAIETLKSQLATESNTLVEAFKGALATQSSLQLAAYNNRLAGELEVHKSRLERDLQVAAQIALSRLPSYRLLWAKMEILSPSIKSDLTDERRRQIAADLTKWYYQEGQGIFLSLEAGDLFLKAKMLLTEQPAPSDDSIRKAFSELRTRLKTDVAVYGPGEGSAQIGV